MMIILNLQLVKLLKFDTLEDYLLTLKTTLGKNAIIIKNRIKDFRKNFQDIFRIHHKLKNLGV